MKKVSVIAIFAGVTISTLSQAELAAPAPTPSPQASEGAEQVDLENIRQKYWARGEESEIGVVQSYQDNRGIFLSYTLQELLYEYPFGAGLGRWGMMSAYFGEPTNWQFPALWAEIQLTGWLYDGGILLWACYASAIASATYHTYRIAGLSETHLSDLASMVLTVQVLIIGLCFTGPVFNTQTGIVFWLLSASAFGAHRTACLSAQQSLEYDEADAASDNPRMDDDPH